jgi:hypothetical protein
MYVPVCLKCGQSEKRETTPTSVGKTRRTVIFRGYKRITEDSRHSEVLLNSFICTYEIHNITRESASVPTYDCQMFYIQILSPHIIISVFFLDPKWDYLIA